MKLTASQKKQIMAQIEEVDKTLLMLKQGRDEAKTVELSRKWNERINAMLDDRFRLMEARDGKAIQ
jgi:hypothetical protein